MAAKARLTARADLDLRIVRRAIEALPRVEASWAEVDRAPRQSVDEVLADRVGYRDEWRDVMARFDQIRRAARADRLTDHQVASHQHLLALAGAGLPIMQRLGLELPSASVLREIKALCPTVASASG